MKRVMIFVSVAVISSLVFTGCEKPPPPPPPQPEQKVHIPTPEELAAEMRTALQPMKDITVSVKGQTGFGSGGEGARDTLNPAVREDVVNKLKAARGKNSASDNGKAAISMVSNDISDLIKTAREQQRWYLTLGLIEAYESLVPGSNKYDRQKEEAEIRWFRPRVMIRGFFTDNSKNGEVSVFVEVTNKRTGVTSELKVRPGEEFEGLRFVKIIGEQKGIRLEYLAVPGLMWDVMMLK